MVAMLNAIDFTREQWSTGHRWIPEVTMGQWDGVEVHHGGVEDSYPRTGDTLPVIRNYHINGRGYRDIWYQLAIDENGKVWECRGADVKNSDRYWLTVLFLGGYNDRPASPLQLNALHRIRATLVEEGGGGALTWHSARGGTVCPGNALTAQLMTLEKDITDVTEAPISIYPESSTPPVAALSETDGYAIVTADGGVFTFGAFLFLGSAYGQLNPGATITAATGNSQGYTLVASDGSIYNFGDDVYSGRVVVTQ